MSGRETQTGITVRALCAAAMALAVLTVASPAATANGQASYATGQTRCDSPGKVYAQKIIVDRKDTDGVDSLTLFLVCQPNRNVAIVDHEGKSYQDLDDFRANNEIFSEGDRITLPRDFPSVDTSRDLDLMTVSGKTNSIASWVWWLTGGIALMVFTSGGGALWLRARRRKAEAQAVALASDDVTATPSAPSE